MQGLKNVLADYMTSQRWLEMKQLFEYWVKMLDTNIGKPNMPDVELYNQYLRANFMIGAPPSELLDLLAQMEDFRITPNTASFNLVLKAMNQNRESAAAEKLLQRMLQTGKESLPDDESYNLVLGMLFLTDIETALRTLDTALRSGYTMSREVFRDCLRSCCNKGKLDSLVSVIERCQKMDQNKALCPDWMMCNSIAEMAMQKDNKDLAYYMLKFMARWIARGELVRPPVLLSANEGLIVAALGTAGRTYCKKLLEGSWEILTHSLRQKKDPSPGSYLAKVHAYSSLGNLPKAFSTLREFEEAYKSSGSEALDEFLCPFTLLKPLVVACSKKGFVTLDEVYYQLENLSHANPPYKSVAALNCVILGCANIWDVDRAYQTFNAIDATFGLTPDVHSYNGLICAFGKLHKRDEAIKVFEHFIGLGLKPNATSYHLLVDTHLIHRDPKAALSVINDMVIAGYEPSRELLKKVRRRCIREMDYDSDDRVETLAKQFKLRMGSEVSRSLLFQLQYTEYV